ncbi:hypothetical protein GN956_G16771 [Arapaima gigas]
MLPCRVRRLPRKQPGLAVLSPARHRAPVSAARSFSSGTNQRCAPSPYRGGGGAEKRGGICMGRRAPLRSRAVEDSRPGEDAGSALWCNGCLTRDVTEGLAHCCSTETRLGVAVSLQLVVQGHCQGPMCPHNLHLPSTPSHWGHKLTAAGSQRSEGNAAEQLCTLRKWRAGLELCVLHKEGLLRRPRFPPSVHQRNFQGS